MIISCSKTSGCKIKTKGSNIIFDENLTVNDKVLPGAGEYEIGDTFFEAGSQITHFHAEGLTLAFIKKNKKQLKEKDLEKLENVDVVLAETANSKEDFSRVTDFIQEIDPSMVIITGITDEGIIKEIEGEKPEEVDSLSISRSDLPSDGRKVYWLRQK